jgi:hypothetical protein
MPMRIFKRLVSDLEKKEACSELMGELLRVAALGMFTVSAIQGVAIYCEGKYGASAPELASLAVHVSLWASIVMSLATFCATLAALDLRRRLLRLGQTERQGTS